MYHFNHTNQAYSE